ncbi:sentrin-specific protease-like [Astyanax mexicanus]|uniref:Sentrin-specific protease-like n=1 Tax=Astyanax mexicanus TaxID=7994 RepID=A0A8T2LMJ8_ASTMX|nr:sentrin-specific protease-like [Astyanax mexicanus]
MSKIGPFKLFSMDFARLAPHRELESEVINAYIHTLVSKYNKSHESKAYLIDSFAMTNLWQGSCNILRKFDPSLYGILLGVINDRHHWTLAVIYPSEKRSVFLDPLGESKTNVTKCLETTRAFMRSKGCNVSRWTCGTVPHPLQRDSTSCGVFVCKFAEGMLEGEHFPFLNTEDAVRKIRKEIAVKLLQESEDLSDVCRFCGETTSHHAVETDLPSKWIACDGCDKWFHQSCVGNPPEEEEFFCQLCKH